MHRSPAYAVYERPYGIAVKILTKNLDFWATTGLSHELARLADRFAGRAFCVDLAQVDYLTGAALGQFVSLHKRLRRSGGRFCLRNVKEFPLEILRVTHLNEVLEIEDREPVRVCA